MPYFHLLSWFFGHISNYQMWVSRNGATLLHQKWMVHSGKSESDLDNLNIHVQENSATPRPPSGLSSPPPPAAAPASPRFDVRCRSRGRRTTGRGRRPPPPAACRMEGLQCQGEGPPAPSHAVPGRLVDSAPVNSLTRRRGHHHFLINVFSFNQVWT